MSTSIEKKVSHSLIPKLFLKQCTLSANTTLPLTVFRIDSFSSIIQGEAKHLYLQSFHPRIEKSCSNITSQLHRRSVVESMAEVDGQQTNIISPSRLCSQYLRDIPLFDQSIMTHSKSSQGSFRIASPSPSEINSSEEEKRRAALTKRKLEDCDSGPVGGKPVNQPKDLFIQNKRSRSDLLGDFQHVVTMSDNTRSSSLLGTEESTTGTFTGASLDTRSNLSNKEFYDDTLQTLKSLDSASPPLPVTDDTKSSQPSILLPVSNTDTKANTTEMLADGRYEKSAGNMSKVMTTEVSDVKHLDECASSKVDTDKDISRSSFDLHSRRTEGYVSSHDVHTQNDKNPSSHHAHVISAQDDALNFDDIEYVKEHIRNEPVDSWQAYMDQQNVKDEKVNLASDQSHLLIPPCPSRKHYDSASGRKDHSMASFTHPYKYHAPPALHPATAPYYHSSSRKQTHPSQHDHSYTNLATRNRTYHGSSDSGTKSTSPAEQHFLKKRDYQHREREYYGYDPYEYDFQRHNPSMYEYHCLQPSFDVRGIEDSTVPPVPPLSEAHYLNERGEQVTSRDTYVVPPPIDIYDQPATNNYHSSGRFQGQRIYGSYTNDRIGEYAKNRPGYHFDPRRQHVNSYHGRHHASNPLYTHKSRSMDSGSTSSLSSNVFYSQKASGTGLQPYYNRQILALSTDDDENWLSEFLCFVRSQCIEVFSATREDVASRMNSKKVLLGQVGIRCRFCAHLPHRERTGRSSSFPSSISRIYQSLTMMLRDHFTKCHAMPPAIQERYLSLKSNASQGATDSKKYWIESANSLGLVDSSDGIRFRNSRYVSGAESSVILEEEDENAAETTVVEALSSI